MNTGMESLTAPRLNSSPDSVEPQPKAGPPLFRSPGLLLCEMWVTVPLPRSFRHRRALGKYLLPFSVALVTVEVSVPSFRRHCSHAGCSPLCCIVINDTFINDTLRDPGSSMTTDSPVRAVACIVLSSIQANTVPVVHVLFHIQTQHFTGSKSLFYVSFFNSTYFLRIGKVKLIIFNDHVVTYKRERVYSMLELHSKEGSTYHFFFFHLYILKPGA